MMKIVTDISIDEDFPEITREFATFSGDCEVFGAPADFHLTIEAKSSGCTPAAFVTWDEPHPAPLDAERVEAALMAAIGTDELRRLQVVAHYRRLEDDPDWCREWVPEYWVTYLENDDPTGLSDEERTACDKWFEALCEEGWSYRGYESTYDGPEYAWCSAIGGLYAACYPVWFERFEAAANL